MWDFLVLFKDKVFTYIEIYHKSDCLNQHYLLVLLLYSQSFKIKKSIIDFRDKIFLKIFIFNAGKIVSKCIENSYTIIANERITRIPK